MSLPNTAPNRAERRRVASQKGGAAQAVVREISFSGIMKAVDVQLAVGLSRVSIWRMERLGQFPARVQVSPSRVGWHGSEVQEWIQARPRVDVADCEGEEVIA